MDRLLISYRSKIVVYTTSHSRALLLYYGLQTKRNVSPPSGDFDIVESTFAYKGGAGKGFRAFGLSSRPRSLNSSLLPVLRCNNSPAE